MTSCLSLRLVAVVSALFCFLTLPPAFAQNADIVFVTQVPITTDFANAFATFGNHRAALDSIPRGGDLWIRYRDGSLKNLTEAAGYGAVGQQGPGAIAVRDPAVHWSGDKVLFSMVVGAPSRQYELNDYVFQLYEIVGLGKNETPVITKVANQPERYNNVMPTYGTDDRIIFVSDRPRNGEAHLYPQRDEYESTATNTGLWSLNPASGDLVLLDHAPSGAFHPLLDSFGRVIYSRWDHLQRDQQADGTDAFGAFNYSGESADSVRIETKAEVFPEPRSNADNPVPNLNLHSFNFFFPWQINEDGTEHETLNHIGRHELAGYFNRSFDDDPNLREHTTANFLFNENRLDIFLQLSEDPLQPGRFLGVHCGEFGTHAAGQIAALAGAPDLTADQMSVEYLTHPATIFPSDTPSAGHSGLYRNPLPLSDGTLVASHTANTREVRNDGSTEQPVSRYDFRLKRLTKNGQYFQAGSTLTNGISKSVTFWNPDTLVSWSGLLWELQPVELRVRERPARRSAHLPAPEQAVFDRLGENVASLKAFLRDNNAALIVGRNVTTRDVADEQQPYNLRVPGGATTIGSSGKVYDVAHLQIFQGDQIRGYSDQNGTPRDGRRVLAQTLHETARFNPPNNIEGAVRVAADGSFAAIVPARRALTWQLTDAEGTGVVRERLWLTFQPGEVRVCGSCHGVNSEDQAGASAPQNPPQALEDLLRYLGHLPTEKPTPCDFDGDRKTDFGVVRRGDNGSGIVFIAFSSGAEPASVEFGSFDADSFFGVDSDRDSLADLIAARHRGTERVDWFTRESSTLAVNFQPWGVQADLPLLADIDGDGSSDRTVFRPSDGSWWSLRSSLGPISLSWGLPGDRPVASDFDGDGWDDIAIWRPAIGYWAVLQSTHGAQTDLEHIIWKQWGLFGDTPLPGDFDGDGASDLAVWRNADGTWYICGSEQDFDCTQGSATQFGLPGDIPVQADVDGDGKRDYVVWRPSDGNWYSKRSSDQAISIRQWGLPGDVPLCGVQ
ncbi:MAG: hypothetical protein KDD69_13105 [Bdellovibrionales bacterium]|nr:hypothetical protein [Bdellovibrionales bacterium]